MPKCCVNIFVAIYLYCYILNSGGGNNLWGRIVSGLNFYPESQQEDPTQFKNVTILTNEEWLTIAPDYEKFPNKEWFTIAPDY